MSSVGVHHAARPLRFQLHALQQLLLRDKKKNMHTDILYASRNPAALPWLQSSSQIFTLCIISGCNATYIRQMPEPGKETIYEPTSQSPSLKVK